MKLNYIDQGIAETTGLNKCTRESKPLYKLLNTQIRLPTMHLFVQYEPEAQYTGQHG